MRVDPSPLQSLAEYCRTHPKTAGHFERAYFFTEDGGRLDAHSVVGSGFTVEEACREARVKLDALMCRAGRVYWRQMPELREFSGNSEQDTFGDANGLVHVRVYARPYYVCNLRVACDPPPDDEIVALTVRPEGASSVSNTLRAAAGISKLWVWRDEKTGAVYGPPPPNLHRCWYMTADSSDPVVSGEDEFRVASPVDRAFGHFS